MLLVLPAACAGPQTQRGQFLYRNYTNENYGICVDVVRKGFRSCPRVSSKVEKPLSLPVTISNTTAEEQCKMKVCACVYVCVCVWPVTICNTTAEEQCKMKVCVCVCVCEPRSVCACACVSAGVCVCVHE